MILRRNMCTKSLDRQYRKTTIYSEKIKERMDDQMRIRWEFIWALSWNARMMENGQEHQAAPRMNSVITVLTPPSWSNDVTMSTLSLCQTYFIVSALNLIVCYHVNECVWREAYSGLLGILSINQMHRNVT